MSRHVKAKPTRRNRIQFTMSQELWARYMFAENLAAELGQAIEYREDFSRWFQKFLDAAVNELLEIKAASDKEAGDDPA